VAALRFGDDVRGSLKSVDSVWRLVIAGAALSKVETTTELAANSVLDRLFGGGVVLCDGAMGTMLCDRGISMNHCYDGLNLSQPQTVASVHTEYLQVGAEIVETNTFGANAYRLERHGLRDQVRQINLAGVRLARQCVAPVAGACVAGAVGPLGVRLGEIRLNEARTAFAEQIRALVEGGPGIGVDLLIVETMTSMAEAGEAIRAAQEVAPELRLVVMMTVDGEGNCLDGTSAETAAGRLTGLGADAVGCNCSDGPATVLSVIERMRGATRLPLAAMPNAGLPLMIESRSVYAVSPEDMAGFAHRFVQAGASLIGGCCGTTPAHTLAMSSALLS
jgi:methionine synthase I (cobalamin-dependent)